MSQEIWVIYQRICTDLLSILCQPSGIDFSEVGTLKSHHCGGSIDIILNVDTSKYIFFKYLRFRCGYYVVL